MAIRKDGGIRLVNNFVELKMHTVPEHYPMANANELLNKVAKKHIILSELYLRKFYWQLDMAPESRQYTGFSTPFGRF